MKEFARAIMRAYLCVLMGGLFLQGLGSLFFRLVPALPASSTLLVRGTFGIDFWHSWMHIIWGMVGMIVLWRGGLRPAIMLALIFGAFYTALGIAGVTIHHPFGLELDLFENGFHLTAGPATLLLGILCAGWLSRPTTAQAHGTKRI